MWGADLSTSAHEDNPEFDFDFASRANLFSPRAWTGRSATSSGAGQKSGIYYALDTDTGALLWKQQVGPQERVDIIQWGSATDGVRIYTASVANLSELKPGQSYRRRLVSPRSRDGTRPLADGRPQGRGPLGPGDRGERRRLLRGDRPGRHDVRPGRRHGTDPLEFRQRRRGVRRAGDRRRGALLGHRLQRAHTPKGPTLYAFELPGATSTIADTVPAGGFGVVVFGGGTNQQLVAAAGCDASRVGFWATGPGGDFVAYVPGTSILAVNAAWNVPIRHPVRDAPDRFLPAGLRRNRPGRIPTPALRHRLY